MSLTACWIVLALLIFRLLFPKTPKWIFCVLWGVVAFRLMIPVVIESPLSLLPSAQVIPQDIVVSQTPAIYSGIPVVNSAVNPLFTQQLAPETNQLEKILEVLAYIWLSGIVVMVLYSIYSYLRLRRKVRVSLCLRNHVYICDDVESPFVLGLIRPKIYLPSGLNEEQIEYVLAHENAHLRRRDHWWKPLGYGILCVHWFNPFLWVAYILLCRDIEVACDEKVVGTMDDLGKKRYSETLLACSIHRRMVMVCPVAFGELSVKSRIRGVLSYKKPTFWILLVSAVVCVVAVVCFLTNPVPCEHIYDSQITEPATCTEKGVQTLTCSLCQHSYTEYVEMLEHVYDDGVVTVEPTCTSTGIKVYSCVCGKQIEESLAITPHIPGEPMFVVEANCRDMGQTSATCSACHAVFLTSTMLPNGVHDLVETELVPATCEAPGEGEITCTRCDHHENCVYEQLEHDYVYTLKPSTCMSLGFESWICQVCGHSRYTQLPQVGHSWVTSGNGWKTCSICGLSSRGGSSSWQDGTTGGITTPSLPIIQWDPYPSITWP